MFGNIKEAHLVHIFYGFYTMVLAYKVELNLKW